MGSRFLYYTSGSFYEIELLDKLSGLISSSDIDFPQIFNRMSSLKHKIMLKHYFMLVPVDESLLVHIKNLNRLVYFITVERLSDIIATIIKYIPLEQWSVLEDPIVYEFVKKHTKFTRYGFFSMLYRMMKERLLPVGKSIPQEVLLCSRRIVFEIDTGIDDVKDIPLIAKNELAMIMYCSETNIFRQDSFIRELTCRCVYNILLFLYSKTAFFSSLLFKAYRDMFRPIDTGMSKIVQSILTDLSYMWIEESVLTDVISHLCVTNEWTPDNLVETMLYALPNRQLCHLYALLNRYKIVLSDHSKQLETRYEPEIILRVKNNINRLEKLLQNYSCDIDSQTIKNPLHYILNPEVLDDCRLPLMSKQGLNELYLREQYSCANSMEYINKKLINLERPGFKEEIEKQIRDLTSKEQKAVYTDHTNINSFHPSKLFCLVCKKDYDKTCEKALKCNEKLSLEENKQRLRMIESCMQKRIMYRHTCAYETEDSHKIKNEDSHQIEIDGLNLSTEKCKGILSSI